MIKVSIYDRDTDKIVSSLKGHNGAVTSVIYHPEDDVVFSSSVDSTVRIWPLGGGAATAIKAHKADVTGISLHATGDYILSVSRDKSWAFSQIRNGRLYDLFDK